MKEYYTEIMDKFFPDIQSELELANESVVHRFHGTWVGHGARLSGLFVISDNKIYFRGKPKMTFTSSTWSLMSSAGKSKNVMIVPFNSIYELKAKKNQFVFKHTLDFMGGKYVGKKEKVVIEMTQGKEGKEKESKEELFKRAEELNSFLIAKMNK
ncbi:MAG TPA: hypothetical protein VMV49_08610 [Candidatus Deferrimicrobium sp.]|nr:hypothetical protein [Candidatus Deferrimicrobium sp.]